MYEICDDHHSRVLCSLDMQFNKHAVVLLHGRERWEMPFTHFFSRKNVFLMLPLSFNTNYDSITVLKQCANRIGFNLGGLEGRNPQILGWGLWWAHRGAVKWYYMLSST